MYRHYFYLVGAHRVCAPLWDFSRGRGVEFSPCDYFLHARGGFVAAGALGPTRSACARRRYFIGILFHLWHNTSTPSARRKMNARIVERRRSARFLRKGRASLIILGLLVVLLLIPR